MIPIDVRKLNLPRGVDMHRCQDESVRLVRYSSSALPDNLLSMQKCPSYYGNGTEYMLSVHLPIQRSVDVLATVAHTSPNCWKVAVSTPLASDIFTLKTLNDVIAVLKRVFQ